METRNTGAPRIRSASIPLFGLVETRINFWESCSAAGAFFNFNTTRLLGLYGAEGLREADFQMLRSADGRKAPADECTQFFVQLGSFVALATDLNVCLELHQFLLTQGT